ncbi:uncharacterized protein LOC131323699 [Rhododendron vialii]|uniref:uncharacterized protein LOC131323699 n=1 Tax=Rhododendron vialii TaxID=182163 RepID=UPI00265FE2C7|nr:uncharacterized protein LOC131323699 [Rhododendron vialii]
MSNLHHHATTMTSKRSSLRLHHHRWVSSIICSTNIPSTTAIRLVKMKRIRPTISARKRKADQISTSEVGEVGGRGRRLRQKKVVREADEEENRPEAEQQVEEDAIEAEEEARPDAQTEEEARTNAHTEAVEPEADAHTDGGST